MTVKAYGANAATDPRQAMDISRRAPGARDVQIHIAFCGERHSDIHKVRANGLAPSIHAYQDIKSSGAFRRWVRTCRASIPATWSGSAASPTAASTARTTTPNNASAILKLNNGAN